MSFQPHTDPAKKERSKLLIQDMREHFRKDLYKDFIASLDTIDQHIKKSHFPSYEIKEVAQVLTQIRECIHNESAWHHLKELYKENPNESVIKDFNSKINELERILTHL